MLHRTRLGNLAAGTLLLRQNARGKFLSSTLFLLNLTILGLALFGDGKAKPDGIGTVEVKAAITVVDVVVVNEVGVIVSIAGEKKSSWC